MTASPPSPISAEQAAWMCGGVSIIVGSRDARLRPHLMRAVGCRLSPDRRSVTLLMPQDSGAPVLDDLRDNGAVAAVFTEPTTNRTLQLKGTDAGVAPCGPDDAALAARYLEGLVDELGRIGFAADVVHAIAGSRSEPVAIRFTIEAAFDQTPGPSAGQPLNAADA